MKPTQLLESKMMALLVFAVCYVTQPCDAEQSSPAGDTERPPKRRLPVDDIRPHDFKLAKQPRLPALDDIVVMTAECYNDPSSPRLKDIARFEVPAERYADVLLQFAQAELDPQPHKEDCELGTVHISLTLGSSLRVVWFWTGRETRLRFSYGGLRYIATGGPLGRDQALSLDALIRKIDAEARATEANFAEADPGSITCGPTLPALEDIKAISAEAYSHILSPIIKDLPPFDVPKDRFADVLEPFMKESKSDQSHPRAGTELGSLRLTLNDGRTRRICWFWMGHKGRMVFSYSGMRFVTVGTAFDADEALEYDGRIRIMKQERDAATRVIKE